MTKDARDQPVVLSVKNVSKDFHLPKEKSNSLKSQIVGIFKKRNKDVDTQYALRDISFEIKKGEFFGIVGRNGSGKSTMLKIISEIYQPTKGSVSHEGKLVPFIELGVGFNPELTGKENVYLNGALLGFSEKEIDSRYDAIVKFAELEDFMEQKLKNYSSGMQVRLAFAVATHAEADILVVDEVLAVGDADFQRKCYDYFKSLKRSKKTVVFVTHDMEAVREYCDRAILIENGKISHQGKPAAVSNEYQKLFNKSSKPKKDLGDQQDSSRWGTRQVFVDNLDISEDDQNIIMNLDLKADERGADSFVVGYRFMNSMGVMIMGGNNHNAYNGQKLSLKPNEKKRISFVIKNVLGSGTITVGVTVRLSDRITTCDDWDNAATLTVTKTESYYPIISPAELKIGKGTLQ